MKLNFEVTITDEQETTLRRSWRKAVDSGEATDLTAKAYGERLFLEQFTATVTDAIESWSDVKARKAALIEAIRAGDAATITAIEVAITPQ